MGQWADSRPAACEQAEIAFAGAVSNRLCKEHCADAGNRICRWGPAVEWREEDFACDGWETRWVDGRAQFRCMVVTTGYFHSVELVCECVLNHEHRE